MRAPCLSTGVRKGSRVPCLPIYVPVGVQAESPDNGSIKIMAFAMFFYLEKTIFNHFLT